MATPSAARPSLSTGQPQSRRPTLQPPPRPVAQPKPVLAVEPDIKPGDLICAVCGAGNDPQRRFCRRCGNSLNAATVATQQVPGFRVAGYRPAYMGRAGRSAGWYVRRVLVLLLAVALLAPVIGYLAVPSFRAQIDSLIGNGGTGVTIAQHPSTNALDKNINSYALVDMSSGQTSLTVSFGQTTELAGIIFHGGATADDFANFGRPREVEITFPGDAKKERMLLDDIPGPQQRCVNPHRMVRTFDVRIVSSWPAGAGTQNLVALREMEFIAGRCP